MRRGRIGMTDSSIKLTSALIILGVWLVAILLGACNVPAAKAKRVLSGAGYTNIILRGHAWFACGEDDTLSTSFTATGPSGVHVDGAVCCSMAMKDCTIRSE